MVRCLAAAAVIWSAGCLSAEDHAATPMFLSLSEGNWNTATLDFADPAGSCTGAMSVHADPVGDHYSLGGFWECAAILNSSFTLSGAVTGTEMAAGSVRILFNSTGYQPVVVDAIVSGDEIHGTANGSGYAAAMFSAKRQ